MPSRSFAQALRPAPAASVRRLLKRPHRPSAVAPAPSLVPAFMQGLSRPRAQLHASVAVPALRTRVAHAAVLMPAARTATSGDCLVPATPVGPPPPARGQLMLPGFAPLPEPRRHAASAGEARETLAAYPDLPAADLCRHAKRLGKAAELLVDSLLMRLGERVLPVDEHEPFDRILWLPGRPLRLQVKARHRCSGHAWLFNVTRGYGRSPEGVRPYGDDDFDILALVVLPEGVVKFVLPGAAHHRIHRREIAGLRARPRDSLDAALSALGLDAAIPRRAPCDAA